jgi:hypothetical protein
MEMGGALVKRICILGAKGGVDLKKLEGQGLIYKENYKSRAEIEFLFKEVDYELILERSRASLQCSGIFGDFQNYFLIGNVVDRVHEAIDHGAGAGLQSMVFRDSYPFGGFNLGLCLRFQRLGVKGVDNVGCG